MNRLVTTLVMLAVVAGPPLLAASWAVQTGWRPPGLADLRQWWQQPLSPGTVLAAVSTIAAAGWLIMTLLVARHVLRRVRAWSSRLRHLPVPSPSQMTATSMAGVAALALPHPDPGPAGTSLPTASADVVGGAVGSTQDQLPPAGFPLPGGGWIPYRTALAVSALAAAVWLNRRHGYQPGPPRPGRHLDDPDLRPLAESVRVVLAGLSDPDATGEDTTQPLGLDAIPAMLSLDGPGAHDAIRGLLVTAALHAARDEPVTYRVLVTHSLLKAALTDADAGVLTRPGIGIVNDSNPRIKGVADLPGTGTITVVPHDLGGNVVRWHVARDGHVLTAGGRRRMCLLGPQAAADLLGLAHETVSNPPLRAVGEMPLPHPDRSIPAGRAAGQLILLGGCELAIGGHAIQVRRTAGRQILAYLAIHPAGASSTELINAIWPGLPADSISNRLYTTLSDLRRQLQPALGADPVVRIDDRYQLNHAQLDSDLAQLRQALAEAAHAVTDAQRRTCARTVTATYSGDLAAGHTWPWLDPHREALRRDVIDAYLLLADNAEPTVAAELLAAAARTDPYNASLRHPTRSSST